MSRGAYALRFAVLASCLAATHAGDKDFWCAKPFTEWSEKEVEKLLRNSPWARPISISTGTMGGGGAGSPSARGGGIPRGGAIGIEDGDLGGGRGREGGPGLGAAQLVAAWYSKPIRQAMARSITLRNPDAPKEQLDKLLNYPDSPYFDILVIGWRGFRGDPEKELGKLREETCLEKKNKGNVALGDIILPKERGQPLVLLFPKEIDGKPTVTLEDKEITLRTRVGQDTIRVRFKLADMVIDGQPAL